MKIYNVLIGCIFLIPISACNNGNGNKRQSNKSTMDTSLNIKLPSKENFISSINGKKTELFYIKNKNGLQAAITNYGARVVGFLVPDKNGNLTDIVVGFDSISKFVNAKERFFGAIVGRFGNRIAKGKFTLEGKSYQLDINNGVNSLHGGSTGFHSRVWDAKQFNNHSVELVYLSKDGEEGYPGTMTTKLIYSLTDKNEFRIEYEMSTDKKTVANITNHNFWNLNGEGSGTINNHELMVKAAKYTPVDSTLIPIGIEAVAGTPFDFTTPHKIGERLEVENVQLKFGKGYDHNFILNKGVTSEPKIVAMIKGDISGIEMEILTTEPGLQFYGGNFMQSLHTFKNGSKDDFRTAFCLETQHFPNSPNQLSFPTTVLEAGSKYKSITIHRFIK